MLQIHESRRDKALELLKYAEKEGNLYTCIHYMITAIKALLYPSVEETLEEIKKVKEAPVFDWCPHVRTTPVACDQGQYGLVICDNCGEAI